MRRRGVPVSLTVSSLAVLACNLYATMANWYYYNENGDKIEVTGGQLKGLAKAGTIAPDTIVETEDGKKARAGKVKGLKFAESESTPESATQDTELPDEPDAFNLATSIPIPPTSQPAPTTPGVFCTYCGQPVQPTTVACTACGADPRVHRKFCYTCGTPVNEVQVICTKCHTPIAGAGSVPIGQTPGQAAPMQSVTQPQPGATAQLVIELPEKFVTYDTANYDILVNGQKMGEIAHKKGQVTSGKTIEITVPTGWIKLEIRSPIWIMINPVSIDCAAGQKKRIIIDPKKNHWLPYAIITGGGCMFMAVMMLVGNSMFGSFGLLIGMLLGVIPIGILARSYSTSVAPNSTEIQH